MVQILVDCDIHWSPEKIAQVGNQLCQVQDTPIAIQIDEQVDVAVRAIITARRRTKDSDVARAMAVGDLEDRIALGGKQCGGVHVAKDTI